MDAGSHGSSPTCDAISVKLVGGLCEGVEVGGKVCSGTDAISLYFINYPLFIISCRALGWSWLLA